jgi:hypothetical protein
MKALDTGSYDSNTGRDKTKLNPGFVEWIA